LSGELRTYDSNIVVRGWDKFLDKYDVTTFLCCWDHRGRSLYSKKHHYSNDGVLEEEGINYNRVKAIFRTNNIKLFNYEEWKNNTDLKFWMRSYMGDQFFNSVFAAFFLRKQVYNFAMETLGEDKSAFDGVFLTRPDSFFIRALPDHPFLETQYVWQQNAPENYFPNRVYDNFLFSGVENIEKICALYDNPIFQTAIETDFGTNLHYLDPCKVIYSYFSLIQLEHKSYDYLHVEPYRREEDLKSHRDHYLGGNKLWCEE